MQDSFEIFSMEKSPGNHEVCEHLDVIMIFEAVLNVTQEFKDVKPENWKFEASYFLKIFLGHVRL